MGLIARVTAPKTQTGNVIRDSAMGLVPETVDKLFTQRLWPPISSAARAARYVEVRDFE